jgi:hypothetical protein
MKAGTRSAWLLATVLLIVGGCPPDSDAGQYVIHFNDELKIARDLALTGNRDSASLRFMCESGGKPVSGSTLHLFIDHSPDLDSNRSFLWVTLNYGVLRSVRLDDHNQSLTEITIPLPPEMLKSENEISFAVEQFSASPNSRKIWTSVKPTSFITIQYDPNRPELALRRLPWPLVDRHSYRPKQLSVLMPERPSSQTLEAAALLIANYAAQAGEALNVHPVRSIDPAAEHLLVVGTPQEQPLRLLDKMPLKLFRLGGEIRVGGNAGPLGDQEGAIALFPGPGKTLTSILLATGNSPAAVSKAARKLIDGHFEGGGAFAKVSQDPQTPPPLARREWKGFAPPANHFTLGALGLGELKFVSQGDYSRSLPILATPDARFQDYGCQITLVFRFDSGVIIDNARLDVDLNGALLNRLEAADVSAGSTRSFRLKIPGHLLRRENVLKITWRGLKSASGNDSAAWLLPESEFDLPRDYHSELPDLGLLQYGLYPLSMRADLSDAILVLPDDSDDEVTAAVFEFAGLLGRLVPADRFAFRVRRRSELGREYEISSHVIEFRIGKLQDGTSLKGAVAAIQERVSPRSAEHYVLSIAAPSARGLTAAMKSVFTEGALKQLRGDTAYIYSNKVASFRTAPVHEMSERFYLTHLQAWLRENWFALPVILTTVSCLLFVGLRLALAQYKNRRAAAAGSQASQALGFTVSSGPKNPS